MSTGTNKRAKKAQKVSSGTMAYFRLHMQQYQDGKDVKALEDTLVAGCVHFAARNGHSDLVTQLVKLGYKHNARESHGFCTETPLIAAARNGHFEIVKILIKAGVNVNFRYKGDSALFLAGQQCHFEMFAALIQAGASIEEIDQIKVLAVASECCFELLIDSQPPLRRIPDPEQDLLIWAMEGMLEVAESCYVDQLQMMIQAGYDVNVLNINNDFTSENYQDETPLMIAVSSGHIRAVQSVIQGGALVNYWIKGYGTAIDVIITNVKNEVYGLEKAWSMIELLREAGASFDYGERGSALEYLSQHLHHPDCFALFERLLNRFPISSLKKEVHCQFHSDTCPLFLAAKSNHVSAVEMLLNAGYPFHQKYKNIGGKTLLMYAAHEGNADIVRVLIRAGANLTAMDDFGKTALQIAKERVEVFPDVIVDMLLEAGER